MSRSPETTGGDDILHAAVDVRIRESRVRTCFLERRQRNRTTGQPYSTFFYKCASGRNLKRSGINETVELTADHALPGYREPNHGRSYPVIKQADHRSNSVVNVGVPKVFGPPDFKAIHEYIFEHFGHETTLGEPQLRFTSDFVRHIELPSYAIIFEPQGNPHPSVIEQHIVCAVAGHLALDKYL